MTQEKKVQTAAVMDVTGVERAAQDAVRAAARMADGIAKEGEKAGKGIEAMSAGAEKAERSVDAATKSISDRIRRLTRDSQRELSSLAASSSGGSGSAAAVEYEAALRGANLAKLQPQIDALRQLQEQANSLSSAMRQAVAGDDFIASINARIGALQRQSQSAKMAEADMLALKAAELGVSRQADPLIAKMREVAAATEQAAAASKQKAEADRFLAGISAQASAIGKTRADLLELQAAQLGVADKAAPMIAALRAADGELMGIGKNAKATQWALRGLPAQFTDIWVSLASGQNPMMVFIQQGGQIKDMFGGIGPAARAMGGYFLGLVNPFTVAAAAAGVMAVAFKAGSDEVSKLAQSAILAGNQLGMTSGSLQDMAKAVSASGAGTFGKAAEFLSQIASSGRIAGDDLARFTAVAIRMEQAGGPALKETAKAAAELGKEPVQASMKLTEQYNYLTAAAYRQIKALEDQGKKTEAAALAQREFFGAMEARTPQMIASLGALERGWLAVATAVSKTWDRIKNIGRQDTTSVQLQSLNSEREALEAALSKMRGTSGSEQLARAGIQREIADIDRRKESLKEIVRLEQRSADAAANRSEITEMTARWLKDEDSFLKSREKAEGEINKVKADGQRLVAEGQITEKQLAERIAAIREKYADKATPRGSIGDPFAADRSAAKEWADDYKRFADLAADAEGKVGGLTRAQIELVKYLESTAYQNMAEPARQLVLQQAYAAINAERAAEENKAWAASVRDAEREYNKLIDAMENSAESAERQLVALSAENQARVIATDSGIDMREAIERVTIARLEERRVVLEKAGNDTAVAMIDREIEARRKLSAEFRKSAADESEKKRIESAIKEYEKLSDTITDALMRGFENGKDFARNFIDTVKNLFRTTVLRPIVQAVVNPVAGAITGVFGVQQGASAATNIVAQSGGSSIAQSLGNLFSAVKGSFDAIGTNVAIAADKIGEWLVMNTSGVLNKAGGTLLQYASQIGSFAQGAAGAFAGFGIGKAISGQYGLGGNSNTAPAIGSIIGTIFGGPIGGAIGGAIGGVVNRAFGRTGKQISGQGIEGTFGAGDATGNSFADWIKKGGWFRSDKVGTDRAELDTEVAAALDAGAAAVYAQTKAWADALKLPGAALSSITSSFKVKFTGDAEKDKAAIAEVIQNYGVSLAGLYADALRPLQRTGESIADTLGRIANLQMFSDNLNQLGGVFSRVANLSVDVRESFISMAGGMDTLWQNAMGFAQNYYNRDEIAGLKAGEIQQALIAAGVEGAAGIRTRGDFRSLVDNTDVGTEAGRQQLAALLSVQGAFVDVADFMAETGATLAEVASLAPQTGPLAQIISPMQQQTEATNILTDGIGMLRDTMERLINAIKDGGGSSASAAPIVSWPSEVYIDYNSQGGGA